MRKKDQIKDEKCKCTHDENCTCDDHCDCENDVVFNTENDLNVAIIKNNKDLLLNEDCCTCINIMLSNDGRILTSFLGCHNPYIVEQLEKAQKMYFKSLKKALKHQYFSDDECDCGCGCGNDCHCDEDCDCGCNDGKDCTCGDDCGCGDKKSKKHKKSKCNCSPDCTCGCQDGKECTCEGNRTCGDNCNCEPGTPNDCGCGGKKNKNKK